MPGCQIQTSHPRNAGAVRTDRHVGTAQRRRAAAARRLAAAREAEAERVHRLEQETASQGVFAVLNSAFLRRPAAGISAASSASVPRSASAGGPASGPADARRGLARLAREIDAARARVSSLQGPVRRNQRDPVTRARAQRALTDAQRTLRQLEDQLQRANASARTDAALSQGKFKF